MKSNWLIKESSHHFLTERCAVCKTKLLVNEQGVCLQCIYDLPRTHNFNKPDNDIEILLAGRFPFERIATFSLFTKEGYLQRLIHELKYNYKPFIGRLIGSIFGADMLKSDFINTIDLIIPVPLHPIKKTIRGYNQAEEFAKGLSGAISIPYSAEELIRIIHNPTQTKLTKSQRWENVEGIFDVKDICAFENKHILLVDDVITTGSTIEACAKTLLKCKNITISVAAIGEAF